MRTRVKNYREMFDPIFGEQRHAAHCLRTSESEWLRVQWSWEDNSFDHLFGTQEQWDRVPRNIYIYCSELDEWIMVHGPWSNKLVKEITKLMEGIADE